MIATKLLEVSDLAAQKFQDILKEQDEDEGMLRVMVMPGANGGIQYMLSVEQVAGEDDFVVDTSTIQVLVDMDSAPLLDGSTIDYMEGLMRSGFVISNPNFQAHGGGGCACGGGGGGCGCGGGGGGGGCGGRRRWRWWWWMWLRWALDTTTPQKAESIGRSGMFAPSLLCESC